MACSPELQSLWKHFHDLQCNICNPEQLAVEASAVNLIPTVVKEQICSHGGTLAEKTRLLILRIEKEVASNPVAFHFFLAIISKHPSLATCSEQLRATLVEHGGVCMNTVAEAIVGAQHTLGDRGPNPLLMEGESASNSDQNDGVRPCLKADSDASVQFPSLTLKNLSEELSDVIQWYILGIKLNLPQSVLATIEANHPRDVERCRLQMLTKWLQMTPTASWSDIVRALYEMDLHSLAQKVQQVHGVPLTSPMPTASQPSAKRIRLDDSQVQTQGPTPTESLPAVKRIRLDDSQVQTQGDAYHNYCSNVCAVYQKAPLQKEDCWPPMQNIEYINLAILKSDRLTFSDDYTLMTIQRSADDIVSKKKRIGYNELFDRLDSGVRILVEGRPGCGKTTLMNKISLDWANKIILKDIALLLLVPLRRFHKKQEVKLDDILRLYDTGHLCNSVGANVSNSGGQGLCVVFDGIDEYPQSSVSGNFVLDVLAGILLPNSVVIASSRPAAAHDIRKYATQRVEVLGFLRPEIQQYIQKHYDGKDDEVKSLSSYLEHHPNIRHMCYLPLHLAMIVYLNDILPNKSLPHTETDVYNKFMLHTLLHDLQKSDNTCSRLSSINQLPVERLNIFHNICRLAYIATDQSEQIFTRDQIQEHIGSREFNLRSLSLLTEDRLLAEQGLEETYSFAHLTFQEFLAAYHLTKLEHVEQLKAAEEHGGDRNMIMVWRFYCGLTKLSGEVPKKAFQTILKEDKVNTLLLLHGVHESQNESACHELLSSRSGVLSISDEVITPADSLAISYCMKNAVSLLEDVSLDSCYLGDDELQVLTSGCSIPLTNVKCLRLRSTVVRKKAMSSFAALLGKFSSLESFEFIKCSRLPSNEDFISSFSSLINLKSFTTDIGFIRKGGIQQFLTKFQHLEEIKCHGTRLTLEMTFGFGKVTSARVVHLTKKQESEVANVQSDLDSYDIKLGRRPLHEADAHVIVELLQMYPGAQSIDAHGCHLTDKVIGVLAEGMKYADLKKLNLSINWTGDKGVSEVASALKGCQKLEELDLQGNSIGDKGVSELVSGLKECQELEQLYLYKNNIGDAGCGALSAALQECKKLQILSLSNNKLTDASIEPLTKLIKTSKSLKALVLYCNNFTEEGEQQLRQAAEERKSYPDFVTLSLSV